MLTLTERVSLGDVDARRTLCGTYVDTRTGGEIMVSGAALPFAQTNARNPDYPDYGGWQPYGEYAWPTVLRLVDSGTWRKIR